GESLKRFFQHNSRIVKQDIEPPMLLFQIVYGAVNLLGVAEVHVKKNCTRRRFCARKFPSRFAGGCVIAIQQCNKRALPLEALCDGATNALRAAADRGHATTEFSRCFRRTHTPSSFLHESLPRYFLHKNQL